MGPTWHLYVMAPTWHLYLMAPTWHLNLMAPTWHLNLRAPTWHLNLRAPTWHLNLRRQQAEEHRLLREQLHRQAEINVALEAKFAAKSGTPDPENVAKTPGHLLERRRKLAYVPEAPVNPFPPPATLTTRIPQLCDLHGNKTYDALSKKSNSSMKYESLVLAPARSYLHGVVCECNATLDAAEDGDLSYDEWQKRFHAVTNSVHGVYAMLCNRGKAVLSATSKSAANADTRVVKDHRDQRWKERKKYDNEKDSKKPAGKGGVAGRRDGETVGDRCVDKSDEEKDDDCFYPDVVKEFNENGKAHVLYDDGDEETLDLSEENFKIIGSSGVSELTDEAADADGEDIDRGGDYKENKRGGAVENFLTRSLCEEALMPSLERSCSVETTDVALGSAP
eukprot:gene6060-biopygen6092